VALLDFPVVKQHLAKSNSVRKGGRADAINHKIIFNRDADLCWFCVDVFG
jgi:hypothetical protein